MRRHATYSLGKLWRDLSPSDVFHAAALSVRDRLVETMLETEQRYQREDPKTINYLSIEFLMGQSWEIIFTTWGFVNCTVRRSGIWARI